MVVPPLLLFFILSFLHFREIELNVLMGQCVKRRIDNIKTLKKEAHAWQQHRNNKKATIHWQFTNKEARIESALFDNYKLT